MAETNFTAKTFASNESREAMFQARPKQTRPVRELFEKEMLHPEPIHLDRQDQVGLLGM